MCCLCTPKPLKRSWSNTSELSCGMLRSSISAIWTTLENILFFLVIADTNLISNCRDENPGIATYEFVPCKIIDDPEQAKTGYVSRLISSNSSGRQMSDYILLQQYEYLDRLTRKMKASGQRLGTSKRAYIAKVLQLSETQVQRIRSVSENLLPELKEKVGTAGLSDLQSRRILPAAQSRSRKKILAEIICPPKVSPASPLVEPAPEQAAELSQKI